MTTQPGDMNREAGKSAHFNALSEIERRRERLLLMTGLFRILQSAGEQAEQSGNTRIGRLKRALIQPVCKLLQDLIRADGISRYRGQEFDRHERQQIEHILNGRGQIFQISGHENTPLFLLVGDQVYRNGER